MPRVALEHPAQYIKFAASRTPRKHRPLRPIPSALAPVWERLTSTALKNHPLLAPLMQDASLVCIDTKTRIATVTTTTAAAANVIMAEKNRFALQRSLHTIFLRSLLIRTNCLK